MVNAQHFLIILSLLPLSTLSIVLLPALDSSATSPRRDIFTKKDGGHISGRETPSRWMPKRSVDRQNPPRHANVGVGGVDVHVHSRRRERLQRRAQVNGSITPLGTALDTYILPVSLGSPPVVYPLQLDLGSSDILLASTLCGSNCPKSRGPTTNPYYNVDAHSDSFLGVNSNGTKWNVSYADQTTASGFLAREHVDISGIDVEDQIFGMITSTNLTLSDQAISGILGLGFPRLSIFARTLLEDNTMISSSSSSSYSSTSAASSSASPSASSRSPYLPPLLESLTTHPHIPYPVFGLALSPPPINSSTLSSTSARPSPSSRFNSQVGSLTLGGVSSLYVSSDPQSGRTLQDIEWHDVVPFGRIAEGQPASKAGSAQGAANGTTEPDPATSSTSSTSTLTGQQRRESDTVGNTTIDSVPHTVDDLTGEDYLYWALELHNVTVNGTDIGLMPSYGSMGVPSIALLDAGFNGIAGPSQDVADIFANIPDARQTSTGQWAAPCNTKMTIGLSFGGRYVQLQPSDWLYAQIDSTSFCLAWPIATAPTGDGIDWQLGTPFLRQVYSVFSYGINGEQAPLVGFLPLADDAVSTVSSSASISSAVPTSSLDTSEYSSASISPYGAVPTTIEPFKATATIDTKLPNAVLPIPTFSLPPYVYVNDPAVTPGILQNQGLANASAYDVGDVPVVRPHNISSMSSSGGGIQVGAVGNDHKNGDAGKRASVGGVGVLTSILLGLLVMVLL